LYDLAGEWMWPQDSDTAVYSADAERILPKVVEWLPEKQGAWYRLGATLGLAGKNTEALAACQRAIDLDPTDAASHNGLGYVYRELGQYDQALAAYQRAIELDPKDASPHNGVGNVYYQLGQYDQALAAYQRAVELDPKLAVAHASLAGCYRKLGRESEAAEQIKIARELIAKEDEYNRACFESICGNTDAALALLKAAIEIEPGRRELARRDPDFDFIRTDARFIALVGG
jgi:tetratricopeptide (TPR) repeat protein